MSAHAALRAHTPPPARERRPASEARGDPGRASQQRAGHVCGRQAASAVVCVPAARAARLNAHPPFAGGMSERAATRRRFFYSITEVHLLHALAAALINNALAGVVRVLGVLASAPHLLRFGLAFVALAAEHLRKVFVAIALTSRHSTQNEENYPQRTWHDYKAKRDFRKQFRFVASHMPRLIAALDLPAVARSAGYAFTADEAISVLLFALATDATLVSINEKFGIKRSRASAIFRWTIQHLRDRWYKPWFLVEGAVVALPARRLLNQEDDARVDGGPRRGREDDVLPKQRLTEKLAHVALARTLALGKPRVQVALVDHVALAVAQAHLDLRGRELARLLSAQRVGNAPTQRA